MPKYCPNCGTEISDKVKYCPSCGAKIENFSLHEDKQSTVEGTSGLDHNNPSGDGSSLPLTECFFCGVKTSKIFYCPLCGHDFCSIHKLHTDHFRKSDRPIEPPKSSYSNQTIKKSDGFLSRYMIIIIVIVAIIGVIFAFSMQIKSAGSDATILPLTLGCVTVRNAEFSDNPQTTIPTALSTITQKYVTVTTPDITIYTSPTSTRIVYPRPMTGTIVSGNYLFGGEGELTIDNTAGSSDVVSSLTYEDSKKTLVAVFIRKGASFTINNMLDGTYNLYVLSGENWDPTNKQFVDNSYYLKFEDPFSYITTRTQATIWEVTIYPVINGNAKTKPISQNDFPKL